MLCQFLQVNLIQIIAKFVAKAKMYETPDLKYVKRGELLGYLVNPECENEGCIKCKEDITCSEAQQLNKELKELREALQLC